MKKSIRRILSAVMSLVLVMSLFPLYNLGTVYAVDRGIESINNSIGNTEAPSNTETLKSPEPQTEEPDFTGYTEISTKEELNAVRDNLRGKYVLTADIVFTKADFAKGGAFYNDGEGWNPIGSSFNNYFSGIFDGNGHTIKGLTIDIESDLNAYVGLFGYVSGGTIKNLGMLDSNIKAVCTSSSPSMSRLAAVGSVAGYVANNATVTGCYNTGTVNSDVKYDSAASITYSGGIVGSLQNSTIINCHNTGKISGCYAGGIAGYAGAGNASAITGCYNTGNINSSYDCCGGIVAYVGKKVVINNCYNMGKIRITSESTNASAFAGGIAGGMLADSSISNCYNTGSISAVNLSLTRDAFAGGIAGYTSGCSISHCYNIGGITATTASSSADKGIGGIVGYMITAVSVVNCYYLNTVGKGSGHGADVATACTLKKMKQQDTFAGFDFNNTWTMDGDEGYLHPELVYILDPNRAFEISTKEQLNAIRNNLSGNYKLIANIVFEASDFEIGGAFYNDGKGWEPIGTDSDNMFTGTFDGNGHTIKGLKINITSDSYVYAGLFGYIDGTVKNLGMLASDIKVNSNTTAHVGGITGSINGSISNCYNTGSIAVEGKYTYAGGIAGSVSSNSIIKCCYNTGNITSSGNSGGIAGALSGSIGNCYNTGIIISGDYCGGIAGDMDDGIISCCYNTGDITSVDGAGGLAGHINDNSTLNECYNTGNVTSSGDSGGIAGCVYSATISDCYNTGSVRNTSLNSYATLGGIVGYIDYGAVTVCYNIGDIVTEDGISSTYIGGIVGIGDVVSSCYYLNTINKGVGDGTDSATSCTLEQMKDQTFFADFDFDSVWTMDGDQDYPYPELKNAKAFLTGDTNGDGEVNSDDAIHLLKYTLFPDMYPINQKSDFDGNGEVNSDDAIYLLKYTLFPDMYPLHNS